MSLSVNDNNQNSAVEHCSTGIHQLVRFQADAMQNINASIEADPAYCLPKIVKGFMLQGAGDTRFSNEITELITQSRALLPGGQGRESELLAALSLATEGRGKEGALALEKMLMESPADLFLHVTAQEQIFWMGQANWMRTIVERAAPAWRATDKDYGSFVALRAFANEEAGYFKEAEHYGRTAVEIDATDVWGAHAVAHVHLMQGEIHRGIEWLENLSGHWGHANQMQHHLWWHLCLFLLELGEYDRILDLLDTRIRNPASPMVQASPAATIDINNYSSLLMRLALYGVDVSAQWQTLAAICASRINNHGSAFSNIHDMMVLTSTDQLDKASILLDSMREHFHCSDLTGSVAVAYRVVGIPVCEAILAHHRKDYKSVLILLGGVRHQLHLMGASHAQRDVFYHMLVYAAGQEHRDDLRREYLNDIERLGFCKIPLRAAYKTVRN